MNISIEKIEKMMENIIEKCQKFYHGRLEIESLMVGSDLELFVYFAEAGYPGRRLRSVISEVKMANADIILRKICSFPNRSFCGGWIVWIFDERIKAIVKEEIEKLKKELPNHEFGIMEEFQYFD